MVLSNALLEPYMFTYKDKEYDLHEIIGSENVYHSKEFGKPIIIKGGIAKLCQFFSFEDQNYEIKWHDFSLPVGTTCSVIIYMNRKRDYKNITQLDSKDAFDFQFIGDGEANMINCKGISAAHLQAMAIKRARCRAVLQELHIDAYGEEEAQDFEEKAPYEKAIKVFLANEITSIASRLATPVEKEALRDSIRQHFNMLPEDKFTVDNLDSKGLLEFYGKLYIKLLEEK